MISVTGKKLAALVAALRKAAEERGRPCVVTTPELLRVFSPPGALNANDVGRIGRNTFARIDLHRALGGRSSWGDMPIYDRGRWILQ